MDVNSLPETVIRQRRSCDLNPGSTAPEFSTLTTRLPSHVPIGEITVIILCETVTSRVDTETLFSATNVYLRNMSGVIRRMYSVDSSTPSDLICTRIHAVFHKMRLSARGVRLGGAHALTPSQWGAHGPESKMLRNDVTDA